MAGYAKSITIVFMARILVNNPQFPAERDFLLIKQSCNSGDDFSLTVFCANETDSYTRFNNL